MVANLFIVRESPISSLLEELVALPILWWSIVMLVLHVLEELLGKRIFGIEFETLIETGDSFFPFTLDVEVECCVILGNPDLFDTFSHNDYINALLESLRDLNFTVKGGLSETVSLDSITYSLDLHLFGGLMWLFWLKSNSFGLDIKGIESLRNITTRHENEINTSAHSFNFSSETVV